MADFKQITVGGVSHPVKDEVARQGLAGKQDKLTFDDTPTANSNNPVKSGGVYQAIQDIDVSSQISGKADKSEMSVVAGTGANADKTTITLKSGTSATVLTQHQDVSGKEDKSNKVTSFSSPTDTQYPSAKLVSDQLATKQDTISDISTIRSGASAGATAYQKPGTGIPSTDLASAVQTSLGKADTAIQSVTVGTTTTGAAGTSASVTNTGTATAPVLSFTIPQGAQGIQGIQGPQGERGPQGNTGVQVDSVASIIHSIDPTATYAAADVAGADAVQDVLSEVTELAGEVDETNRKLYGEDEIAINIPSFEEGNGTIVTLTFHNSGNYGNWRYILIPVSTYRSRTMNIVPLSPSYGTQFIFMKDSVLTNNADVNYADGYSGGVQNKFTPFDVVIPNDAEYLFVRTQNVSTQVSYCPQSITIAGTTGDIENIESSINNKVDKIAGKGLSTNDYTDADKAKLSALVQDETIFGVKWDESNYSDLGTRTLGAIGKNATIGIGNTNGNSDFDNIYPWSEMKRCNIKANANGAKIVTFEGETGFTLDGSNGDVFVRIPKFKTSRFIDSDGKMNVVIGDGDVHPAFIENGIELDEIFVGAFEASIANSAMYSKAGVIPGNDYTGAEFLGFATARGIGYTLADMRYMDAIWRLMSVEFGCRNTNRILGYGYSDYRQPTNVSSQSYLKVSEPATNSNTITGGYPDSNSRRLALLCEFAAGNNITICDGNQQNIVAQRKIISVTCASTSDKLVIVFDGEPINITTDMFFGNAPCDCNYCESIGDSYKLNWHTGRAARPIIASSGKSEDAINPCRYRWIENPVGNVWQFLPDIKFSNLQMYVCKDIENYTMTTSLNNYKPIGDVLPEQSTNGNKNDVNSVSQPNYWVVSLLNDIFARGNAFAKTFDTIHDGTLLSVNGYGGYYYLNQGNRFVVAGGGFDHLYRSNILTFRAQISETEKWFLYGARLMFKNV